MASTESAPSVGPRFHRNALSRFPMPPHAWRVRSSSNRSDPDRRGVTRDRRAPQLVPGRRAGGDGRQDQAGGFVDGLLILPPLDRAAYHSYCYLTTSRYEIARVSFTE